MGNNVSSIESTGILTNEYPGQTGQLFECRMFRHKIKVIEGDDFVKTLSWSLEGDIPLNLSIDNSGVINGHIEILDLQPSCKLQVSPDEKMKIDGSNWTAGRFQGNKHRFDMVVKWTYEFKQPEGNGGGGRVLGSNTKTLKSKVYIDVYLDNDITNYIFCRKYLDAKESIIDGPVRPEDRIEKHYFDINSKKYDYTNFEEFIKVHPGPFGRCTGK